MTKMGESKSLYLTVKRTHQNQLIKCSNIVIPAYNTVLSVVWEKWTL
jgi:hypothetical protein